MTPSSVFAALFAILVSACTVVDVRPDVPAVASAARISDPTAGPALRVRASRVIGTRVNLRQPVLVGTSGDEVTVTFATRNQEGATLALDPVTLETRRVVPYRYEARVRSMMPGYLPFAVARVSLNGAGQFSTWTDEASGRVYAEAEGGPSAHDRATPAIAVSTEDVVGAPRAASADGRLVVVAFLISTVDGFALVATSVDTSRVVDGVSTTPSLGNVSVAPT